jgi:hypothetical protein
MTVEPLLRRIYCLAAYSEGAEGMSERDCRDDYEEMFVSLCGRIERFLVRGIAVALALLLTAQALLQIPAVRSLLTRVDTLEGVPYRHVTEQPAGAPPTSPQRK